MTAIHAQNVEATTGFEPVNRGFAALYTVLAEHETTPLRATRSYSEQLLAVDHSVDQRAGA